MPPAWPSPEHAVAVTGRPVALAGHVGAAVVATARVVVVVYPVLVLSLVGAVGRAVLVVSAAVVVCCLLLFVEVAQTPAEAPAPSSPQVLLPTHLVWGTQSATVAPLIIDQDYHRHPSAETILCHCGHHAPSRFFVNAFVFGVFCFTVCPLFHHSVWFFDDTWFCVDMHATWGRTLIWKTLRAPHAWDKTRNKRRSLLSSSVCWPHSSCFLLLSSSVIGENCCCLAAVYVGHIVLAFLLLSSSIVLVHVYVWWKLKIKPLKQLLPTTNSYISSRRRELL